MNPLTVAIRAHGGDRIGLGHIRRCLSLAQALSRQGVAVKFITNKDKAVEDLVRENDFGVKQVESGTDFEQTQTAFEHWKASALLVDSYDIGADYLSRIRSHVGLLIAIDDLGNRTLPVDIVINGAAYAPQLHYEAGVLLL